MSAPVFTGHVAKKAIDFVHDFGGRTFAEPENAISFLESLFKMCAQQAREATIIELADRLATIRERVIKQDGSCEELEWSETELRSMVVEEQEERASHDPGR